MRARSAVRDFSTRGVVEWLIKHEAKPIALSYTRTLLECCKSRTARPSVRINWLIVKLPDLDRHLHLRLAS